jgi:hypothetical protein
VAFIFEFESHLEHVTSWKKSCCVFSNIPGVVILVAAFRRKVLPTRLHGVVTLSSTAGSIFLIIVYAVCYAMLCYAVSQKIGVRDPVM